LRNGPSPWASSEIVGALTIMGQIEKAMDASRETIRLLERMQRGCPS
jgi:hypothetical protein